MSVRPRVGLVPHDLRSPHTVDGRPVTIDALGPGIAEDADPLPIVEGLRLPMDEVVAHEQFYAVVVPFGLLLQVLETAHVHVRTYHQVAAAVVLAADVGIASGSLNAGMFVVAEDGVAVQQVVVVPAVAAQCIGRPCPAAVVHVTIQVSVVTRLVVALAGLSLGSRQQPRYQRQHQESFHHTHVYLLGLGHKDTTKSAHLLHFSAKNLAQAQDFD